MTDGIQRIVIHWTGGGPRAGDADLRQYHIVVEQSGRIVPGDHPPAANADPLGPSYAAHVRGYNTGSLGVALAGMFGAVERPFSAGPHPITHEQVQAAARFIAAELAERGMPCTLETCLTHAEAALPPHDRPQAGKWDVNWLPGHDAPLTPREAGDTLRAMIRRHMPPADDPEGALRLVQLGLEKLEHDPGPIDGLWGPRTRAAVERLLAAEGRPAR